MIAYAPRVRIGLAVLVAAFLLVGLPAFLLNAGNGSNSDAAQAVADDPASEEVAVVDDLAPDGLAAEVGVEPATDIGIRDPSLLPRLPSDHERSADLFDEDGCVILVDDEGTVCPGEVPDALRDEIPARADVSSRLKGFSGLYYTDVFDANEVVLLSESVYMSSGDQWSATGLVRNDTKRPVQKVTVTASLFGSDGSLRETVTGEVAIGILRPGEPGPFILSSQMKAGEVARVEWKVEATPSLESDVGATRDLEVLGARRLPFGKREQVGSGPFARFDEKGEPFPYLLMFQVSNIGEDPAPSVAVVVGWLDEQRRLRWFTDEWFEFGSDQPTTLRERPLQWGMSGVVAVDDPELGPQLEYWSTIFWVVSQ